MILPNPQHVETESAAPDAGGEAILGFLSTPRPVRPSQDWDDKVAQLRFDARKYALGVLDIAGKDPLPETSRTTPVHERLAEMKGYADLLLKTLQKTVSTVPNKKYAFDFQAPSLPKMDDMDMERSEFLPFMFDQLESIRISPCYDYGAKWFTDLADYYVRRSFEEDSPIGKFWRFYVKDAAARFSAPVSPEGLSSKVEMTDMGCFAAYAGLRAGIPWETLAHEPTGAMAYFRERLGQLVIFYAMCLIQSSTPQSYPRLFINDRSREAIRDSLGGYFKKCEPVLAKNIADLDQRASEKKATLEKRKRRR